MKVREENSMVSGSPTDKSADGPSTSDDYWNSGCYSEKANLNTSAFYYRTPMDAPWAKKRYELSVSGLHEEITDFYHWVRPTTLEAQVRKRVFLKVESAIREKWKGLNVRISMFGSLRTNLFLPSSDIDVLVECDQWEYSPLEQTADYLRSTSLTENINVFADAFVPIVKMVDRDTNLSIDISFNTVQGVRAADYIEKVKEEFPVIEPLVLLLKQFLHHRLLNQTFTGGLSSYGLILMLVNFLQIHANYMRGKQLYDLEVNLGELLLRFFEVYSQEFNYDYVGISVGHMRYISKESTAKIGTLMLEDPLLSTNDVGRSTYNFTCIANAFAQALQLLIITITVRDRGADNADWNRMYSGTLLSRIIPFSDKEMFFREWLKVRSEGFVFKKTEEKKFNTLMVTNTLIAPVCDLARMPMVRKLAHQKVSKALTITSPDSTKSEKSENGRDTKSPVSITSDEEVGKKLENAADTTIGANGTWQNDSTISEKTIIQDESSQLELLTENPSTSIIAEDTSREPSSERSETETISSNTSSLSAKTSESMNSVSTTTADDSICRQNGHLTQDSNQKTSSKEEVFKKPLQPNGHFQRNGNYQRGGGYNSGRYNDNGGYRGRRNQQNGGDNRGGYQRGYSSTSENEGQTKDRQRKQSRRDSERSNDSYASSNSSRRSDYKKNGKPTDEKESTDGFRGRTSSNSSAYSASSGHGQNGRKRGGGGGGRGYHRDERRNGNGNNADRSGYRWNDERKTTVSTHNVTTQAPTPVATEKKVNTVQSNQPTQMNGTKTLNGETKPVYRKPTYSDKLNGNLPRKMTTPHGTEKRETARKSPIKGASFYSDVDGVTELREELREAVQNY